MEEGEEGEARGAGRSAEIKKTRRANHSDFPIIYCRGGGEMVSQKTVR